MLLRHFKCGEAAEIWSTIREKTSKGKETNVRPLYSRSVGFIGSHMVDRLVNMTWKVVVVDSLVNHRAAVHPDVLSLPRRPGGSRLYAHCFYEHADIDVSTCGLLTGRESMASIEMF